MTREEAIEQLKQIPINDGVSDNYMKTIYEAIDMAIEALERIEAYEGNGYYFMFEAQESENKE